jgi:hypothetical protein
MSSRSSRHVLRGTLVASLLLLAGLASASLSQAAALPTISVAVSKTTISVGGTLQSGGVNVASTATGTKEASATFILLKPGVTVAEVFAFLATNKAGADPNTVSKFGSIVFDAEAPVGKSEAQTTLQPGTYVALSAEGEKSAAWPKTSFILTTSAAPQALPAPGAVERTIDFGFRGPSVLHVGELVGFENEGYVVHMDLAFAVKSKSAGKQLVKDLASGNEKGAGKLIAGPPAAFANPMSTGGYQQAVITAKPGFYVQVCFMSTQDGRTHTRLGMERLIKIAK